MIYTKKKDFKLFVLYIDPTLTWFTLAICDGGIYEPTSCCFGVPRLSIISGWICVFPDSINICMCAP